MSDDECFIEAMKKTISLFKKYKAPSFTLSSTSDAVSTRETHDSLAVKYAGEKKATDVTTIKAS